MWFQSKYLYSFVVVGFIFLPHWVFGQIGVQYKIDLKQKSNISSFKINTKLKKLTNTQLPHFDAEKLPIFCKIEHKLEKKTKFPVRFRLGTVDVVDKMEGK